jgi:hypothetical protein
MDGKFLTKETNELISQFLFKLLNKKVPFFLRFVLKKLIGIVLSFAGKYADKVIPDKVDALINKAINQLFKKDYDNAAISIATVENIMIDIPRISEDYEQKAFLSSTEVLINLIKNSSVKRI